MYKIIIVGEDHNNDVGRHFVFDIMKYCFEKELRSFKCLIEMEPSNYDSFKNDCEKGKKFTKPEDKFLNEIYSLSYHAKGMEPIDIPLKELFNDIASKKVTPSLLSFPISLIPPKESSLSLLEDNYDDEDNKSDNVVNFAKSASEDKILSLKGDEIVKLYRDDDVMVHRNKYFIEKLKQATSQDSDIIIIMLVGNVHVSGRNIFYPGLITLLKNKTDLGEFYELRADDKYDKNIMVNFQGIDYNHKIVTDAFSDVTKILDNFNVELTAQTPEVVDTLI